MRAAIEVAAQLGLHVDDAVLIQETNHTIVWLRPYPIIAKVGTRSGSAVALNHEYEVASALTAAGAPIAPLLPDVRPIRDLHTGFLVTLWTRLDNDATAVVGQVDVGLSLQSVHEAMAQITVELPNFRVGLERTQVSLSGHTVATAHLRDGETYRFSLQPGTYTVSTGSLASKVRVVVTAGKTTTANVVNQIP